MESGGNSSMKSSRNSKKKSLIFLTYRAKEKAKNFYYSLFPYIDDKVLLELKLVELEKKIHPESDSLRK
jgi:hypothetical protein